MKTCRIPDQTFQIIAKARRIFRKRLREYPKNWEELDIDLYRLALEEAEQRVVTPRRIPPGWELPRHTHYK